MGTVTCDLEGRLWAALANIALTCSGFCAWRENQDAICGFDPRRSRSLCEEPWKVLPGLFCIEAATQHPT